MKKWIHAKSKVEASKLNKTKVSSASSFDAKKAFEQFKKKYPKAYEVLGE